MKKKIWLIAVAFGFVFAMFAAGNTGVDYYRQKYGALEYVYVDVTISADDVGKMEKSNAESGASSYTFKQYYDSFVKYASASPDLCSYEVRSNGDVSLSVMFVDAYVSSSLIEENFRAETEKGFFRNKYTVSYDNPLSTLAGKLHKYASEDASSFTEAEKATWQYMLAGGVRANGALILDGITKIFPAILEVDLSQIKSTYNFSAPKWYESGAPATTDKYGATFMTWTDEAETLTYSYYVPNSVGWGITLGGAVILLMVILWLIFGRKKDQPDFADYRSMEEAEINSRIQQTLEPGGSSADGAAETPSAPEDGYAGRGVFRENGRTVDVFGNEAEKAPEEIGAGESDVGEGRENIDPFN